MRHRITILLALLLLTPAVVTAQRAKKVRVTAEGTAAGTDVVVTKRDALYDAKLNALRNAGIDETVQSFTTMVLGTDQKSMLQSAASEVSMLMIDGRVRLLDEPRYETEAPNQDNLMRIQCRIRAEVTVEEHPDETFRIKVDGLRATYREGEKVTFNITPFADCWLRVFWFDRATTATVEGDQLFPTARHYNDLMLHDGQAYAFPSMPAEFLKGNPQRLEAFKQGFQPMETNILFVVALKKAIPYNKEDCSYEKFIEWLMEIPADQRFVYWTPIGIVEK